MTSSPVPPRARLHGLDGLRAIAVTLVVVYHLFPGAGLPGGFAGVDVFFVISGFLITTLLLREHSETGRIALVPFWRRRARRLLPALGLLLTVCASFAWLIGGDVLVRLGAQLVGALTFTYNWVSIGAGSGYFSATAPELFRNLWSLAVEEQFYVLWPLLLPLLLLAKSTVARILIALAVAAASATWMWHIASSADPTRAYFGTDTHAFGLLIGVALAFWMQRTLTLPARFHSVGGKLFGVIAGPVALAGIVGLAMLPVSAWTFPGTLLLSSVLTAALIAIGTHPGSWFGRAIDIQPLRWIGDRSYGIYLWHWPVLVLLMAASQGAGPEVGVPIGIGIGALVITLVAAEVSYRFIEQPVRRYGFRGSLRRLGGRLAGTPASRFAAICGIVVAALAIGGTSAAVAAAPTVTSAEAAIAAGAAAMADHDEEPTSEPVPAPTAEPEPEPEPDVPMPGSPVPSPAPTPVAGTEISAIGDSVMLASAQGLFEKFPGIAVDATVSRSMWTAPGILQQLVDSGQLRRYVVISLGTNGPIDTGTLDEATQIIGPDRQLILVNAFAPRDWIPGVNENLRAFAAQHPGVIVADWSGAIGGQVGLLAGDQIHPGGAGGRVYADVVANAIASAEAYITHQQYIAAWREYRRENPLTRTLE